MVNVRRMHAVLHILVHKEQLLNCTSMHMKHTKIIVIHVRTQSKLALNFSFNNEDLQREVSSETHS